MLGVLSVLEKTYRENKGLCRETFQHLVLLVFSNLNDQKAFEEMVQQSGFVSLL